MALNTNQWSKTIGLVDYQEPFIISSRKYCWDWHKLFDMGKAKRASEAFYSYTGFGAPVALGELVNVTYRDPSELDSLTLTAVKYALGMVISEEMEEDNTQISGFVKKMGTELGKSHAYIRDVLAANVYNEAFSTTNQTVWDDGALCAAHTTKVSADTITNSQTAAPLSKSTLWDMLKYFDYGIVTQAGLPAIATGPFHLITHPSNRDKVEKILGSPLESDTADNNKNTLADKKIIPVYSRLLSDTARYFLQASEQQQYMPFWIRKDVTTKWGDSFDNIGRKCRTHQRLLVGPVTYEYIVGNDG
jgi:hypothetical protein